MKKLFLLMFCMILLVGTVSSADFDDVKYYDEETSTYTLENFFGLGKTIADLELKTPQNNLVHLGYGDIARIEIRNGEYDYEEIINGIELYNIRDGMKEVIRNVDYKYLTYIEVPNREASCVDIEDENKTTYQECSWIQNGTKLEEQWLPFTENSLLKGETITLGIFTDVQRGDHIEWVINVYGNEKLTAWATWTESLNVDIVTYLKMDEEDTTGLGNIIDELGTNNGTNDGADNTTGKIIFGYDFERDDSDRIVLGNSDLAPDGNFTTDLWFNIESFNDNQRIIALKDTLNFHLTTVGTSLYVSFSGTPGNDLIASGLSTGQWYYTMVSYDKSAGISRAYFNATKTIENSSILTSPSASTDNIGNNDASALPYDGKTDEHGFWSRVLTDAEAIQRFNNFLGISFTDVFAAEITLNSPIDNFNTSNPTITFNGTIVDRSGNNIQNVSLFLDGVLNETNSSGINNTNYIFTKTVLDGNHNWTYQACDDTDLCSTAITRNFTVDTTNPSVIILAPPIIVDYHLINTNLFFNWSANDTSLDTCLYEFEGVNTTVVCSTNTTEVTITNATNRTIIFYVNDTFGNSNVTTRSWNYTIFENGQTFNSTAFETSTQNYFINIETNGSTPSAATLFYDGVSQGAATITALGGDVFNITDSLDVPVIATATKNNSIIWSITSNSQTQNSTLINQTAADVSFVFCNSTFNIPYINFAFKNETIAEESVNATIDSDWNYWLGTGDIFQTLTFTNNTENTNYTFCLSPGNQTLNANATIRYNNDISQQRTLQDDFILTNTTTQRILFLLPTSDGVFVTFQVVNIADQPISNVNVLVEENSNDIENKLTDDAGAVTFFLDPDITYKFTFTAEGFDVFITNLAPTQATFTITLGAGEVITQPDFTRGFNYSIQPKNRVLPTNTDFSFNFSLTSSVFTLTQFGFNLTNSTSELLGIVNSTSNGGIVAITINTSDNSQITINYFWNVDGNITRGSFTWLVFNETGTGFSIKNFFDDLSTYLTSGLFGLNNFSLVLIIFMGIFTFVGVLSFKFGLNSVPAIVLTFAILILIFEVVLGLIPSPPGVPEGVPFATILIGILLVGLLVKETIT